MTTMMFEKYEGEAPWWATMLAPPRKVCLLTGDAATAFRRWWANHIRAQRHVSHRKLRCIGGPFAGQIIELSTGDSAWIKVGSWPVGRYWGSYEIAHWHERGRAR